MNILHLSDIHFGRNHYSLPDPFDRKDEILSKLIDTIAGLPANMKPDLILVTGDIAWRGKTSEFNEAFDWFQQLIEALDIESDQIVFCPGNHDLNRNVATNFKETDLQNNNNRLDIQKCDEYSKYENVHLLEPRFHNYNLFCKKMNMQPYSYTLDDGTVEYSYLVGSNHFTFAGQKYTIACFNTANFPYGKVLKDDQMFLGLPQILNLRQNHILHNPDSSDNTDAYCIGLFHHADRFLHPNEQCEYDGRKASLPLLLQSVDLALCGHTETGGMPLVRHYHEGGKLLTGGAAYYNDEHPNSFSLIHIDASKNMEVCSFHFDGNDWSPFHSLDEYHWQREAGTPIWKNPITDYPILTFFVDIDGIQRNIYTGPFKLSYKLIDGKVMSSMHNRVNPARSIEIWTDEPSAEIAGQGVHIRHAPGQWQMISSRITIAKYNEFIAGHIAHAKQAFSGFKDRLGKVQFAVSMEIPKMQEEFLGKSSQLSSYKALQKIEKHFDVRFLHPYPGGLTQKEVHFANLLIDFIDSGDIAFTVDMLDGNFFVAHNRNEIIHAAKIGQCDGTIAFHFTRKLSVQFLGTSFRLGECDIYLKGFKIKDLNDVNRKIATWEDGDMRRVDVVAPERIEWRLIPKKGQVTKDPLDLYGVYTISFPEEAGVPIAPSLENFIIF